MAEIESSTLISDDALNRIKQVGEGLSDVADELDKIIERGEASQEVLDMAKTMKALDSEVKKLQNDNKKLTDAHKKLEDQLKENNKRLEENKKKLQQQGEAMEALDNQIGGNISRWKQLGKELLAIAKNPIILTLGVIIGLLAAATSAVKTFWTHTGEGEDIAARQAHTWQQFFNVLKNGWSDLGKQIQDFFGEDGSDQMINFIFEAAKIMFPALTLWLNKLQKDFNRTSAEAKKLADLLDDIGTRQAINIERRAKTERDANRLLLESEDKLMRTDLDRLVRLEQYNKLKKEQMEIDLAIAKDNAKAVLYEIGLQHSLTAAQVERMTFAERDAKFNGEQMKRIAEANAEVIRLEGAYYQEVKKTSAKITALKQEMYRKEVELAKKAAAEIIKLGEDMVAREDFNLRSQIADVQKQTTERLKDEKLHWRQRAQIIEDSEELIKQMREQARIEEINNQIKAMEVSFRLLEFDAEQQALIAEKLKELKLQLINEVYENSKNVGKTQLEKDIENLQVLQEHYNNFASSISEIFNNLTESRLASLDREEAAMERVFDTELRMAGDNKDRKIEIENEADRKRQELERRRIREMRKAAIFEKVTALIQAGINGALAVTNQLAKGDPYTAFARAAAAGIAAAIQVVAIASKEIPQYYKGGKTKQNIISAGEKGFEHYRTPTGLEGFTPNSATIMNLPIGTEISSHEDTLQMLANRAIAKEGLGNRDDIQYGRILGRKLDKLNHTIANKPVVEVNYTPRGVEGLLIKAMNRIKFNNTLYR